MDRIDTLEKEVSELKTMIAQLVQAIATRPAAPVQPGTNRKWDAEQRKFLEDLWLEFPEDLEEIVKRQNEEFCPKGFVARSKSAIACQLWNLVDDRTQLSEETYNIAKKYMKKD